MGSLAQMNQMFGQSPDEQVLIPSVGDTSLEGFIAKMESGPLETLTFYKGTVTIKFDSVKHIYYRVDPVAGNLIRANNVSSVCHIIDRSVQLLPWGAKKQAEKLLRIVPTKMTAAGLVIPEMRFEDFTKLVMESKTAHKDELEEAGDIGAMAHDWLDKYIKSVIVRDTAAQRGYLTTMCIDDRGTSCCIGALDWMKQHNVRFQSTETKVYSLEFDYAGTFDGIALVDSCQDPHCCPHPFLNRLSIVDWKSANHLHIEFCFQTAAYERAVKEEQGLDITDRWVLRLGKEDGKFDPWHLTPDEYEEDLAGYLACLRLYKLVESVDDRMNVRKASIRNAKKQAKLLAKEFAEATEKVQKAVTRAVKKLEKEEAKAAEKAAKAAAKAAKKKTKKPEPVANEAQVLIGRAAELSPAVAALLKEAHDEPVCTETQSAREGPAKPQLEHENENMHQVFNLPTE
jgi:hypothetical protein